MHAKVAMLAVAVLLMLGACTDSKGYPTEFGQIMQRMGENMRENARNRVTCYQTGNVINCY